MERRAGFIEFERDVLFSQQSVHTHTAAPLALISF
jgi:hypothetical protein